MHELIRRILKLPIFSHHRRIFKIFKGFNTPSYSADKKNIKPKLSQFIDYLYLYFLLKILPSNYHLLGFDTKKRKEFKKYIGCTETDPYHLRKLYPLWGPNTILIRDKYIFKVICKYHDLPVPKLYGIFGNGLQNNLSTELQHLMLENSAESTVLKPSHGSLGAGIHFISRDKLNNLKNSGPWSTGEYIAEEHIRQHPELDKINPHSLNTIRIITILCLDGTVEFFAAILRTSSSLLQVDNFTMGGIAIGIDMSTGRLKKKGFIKQFVLHEPIRMEKPIKTETIHRIVETIKNQSIVKPGKILERHPVTQTEFHNFEIPYWDELKNIVMKAQKIFHHIKSIGWDVAISPEGPVIIEGNQLWGSIGLQAANGGLLTRKNKKLFVQYGISFYE